LKVVATYGGLSDEHWVTQGEVTISFPALAIGGTLLDAGLVLVGVGGLVALIVSMELLRGFLRKRKTAAE
jgi:threonine dehydratase